MRETFFLSVIWTGIGAATGALFEYMLRVLGARYMDADLFGMFSLIITIYLIGGTLATCGFQNVLPRYISIYDVQNRHDRFSSLVMWSNRIVLTSAIIITILLLLTAWGTESIHWKKSMFVAGLMVPFYAFSEQIFSILRGLRKTKLAMCQRQFIVRGAPLLFWLFVLLLSNYSESIFFWSGLSGLFFGMILGVLMGWEYIRFGFSSRPEVINRKEIIQFARPLFVTNILNQLYGRMDIIIAGTILPLRMVGLYSAAKVLPLLLRLFPQLFNFIILPYTSEHVEKNNHEKIKTRFVQVTNLLSLISFGLAGIIYCGSDYLVHALIGEEYEGVVLTMNILLCAYLITVVPGTTGTIIIGYGDSKSYLYTSVAALLAGIVFQYLFAIKWGMVGIAIGVFSMNIVMMSARLFILLKIIGRPAFSLSDSLPCVSFLLLLSAHKINIIETGTLTSIMSWIGSYTIVILAIMYLSPSYNEMLKISIGRIKSYFKHYG